MQTALPFVPSLYIVQLTAKASFLVLCAVYVLHKKMGKCFFVQRKFNDFAKEPFLLNAVLYSFRENGGLDRKKYIENAKNRIWIEKMSA